MIDITENAVKKILEILTKQDPKPLGVRVAVVGGGCSGFQYSMAFEKTGKGPLDKEYRFGDLTVFVDQASMLYLDGVRIDYAESIEATGFRFDNPNVKHTCGCGSSFEV